MSWQWVLAFVPHQSPMTGQHAVDMTMSGVPDGVLPESTGHGVCMHGNSMLHTGHGMGMPGNNMAHGAHATMNVPPHGMQNPAGGHTMPPGGTMHVPPHASTTVPTMPPDGTRGDGTMPVKPMPTMPPDGNRFDGTMPVRPMPTMPPAPPHAHGTMPVSGGPMPTMPHDGANVPPHGTMPVSGGPVPTMPHDGANLPPHGTMPVSGGPGPTPDGAVHTPPPHAMPFPPGPLNETMPPDGTRDGTKPCEGTPSPMAAPRAMPGDDAQYVNVEPLVEPEPTGIGAPRVPAPGPVRPPQVVPARYEYVVEEKPEEKPAEIVSWSKRGPKSQNWGPYVLPTPKHEAMPKKPEKHEDREDAAGNDGWWEWEKTSKQSSTYEEREVASWGSQGHSSHGYDSGNRYGDGDEWCP